MHSAPILVCLPTNFVLVLSNLMGCLPPYVYFAPYVYFGCLKPPICYKQEAPTSASCGAPRCFVQHISRPDLGDASTSYQGRVLT